MHKLVHRLLDGDRRAVARMISVIENHTADKEQLLSELYPHTGRAFVLGVTGSPGAGKSSLVDCLITHLRKQNLTIGVIAVDPTSPFSGGQFWGIGSECRTMLWTMVFSFAVWARGVVWGGLARATKQAVRVLDAYGRDIVLVETVGVGQSELDIVAAADTTVVVLNPETGDGIQTIKAGMMEIADIFVVNKCDRDGADRTAADVNAMLDLGHGKNPAWRPPVILTSALDETGIPELAAAIDKHREFATSTGETAIRRAHQIKSEVAEIIEHHLQEILWRKVRANREMLKLLEDVVERKLDPYAMAKQMIASFLLEDIGVPNKGEGT